MDAILDSRFERIEAALQTLIDSITTYNPSPAAAIDLVAADDELAESLETLTQHQENHARILSLQSTAAALDAQLKTSLTLLAEARKELVSAPLRVSDDADTNGVGIGARNGATVARREDVDFEMLVSYARRISRYTVPPTLRQRLALPSARIKDGTDVSMNNGEVPTTGAQAVQAPAIDAAATSPQPPSAALAPGEAPQLMATGQEQSPTSPLQPAPQAEDRAPPLPEMTGIGWTALSAPEKAQLDKLSQVEFVPFPRDEDVKSGALARIQAMIDQGMDPASMTGRPGEADADGKGHEGQEQAGRTQEERRAADEARRRAAAERAAGDAKREEASGAHEKKESAFSGLELYDPDED